MSNKKHKAQDHIPIHDMNGNFVVFGHPGFLRKLSKDNRGFFQKSLISLQTSFVLSNPITPNNYPELIPFLKDNNVSVNANQSTGELDTTTSTSSATIPTSTTVTKDPNRISLNEKFNAKFDQRLEAAKKEAVQETLGIMSDVLASAAHPPNYTNVLKNIPEPYRSKLLYGDFGPVSPEERLHNYDKKLIDPPGSLPVGTTSTNTPFSISDVDIKALKESMREAIKDSRKVTGEINGVKFGFDEAVPGADTTAFSYIQTYGDPPGTVSTGSTTNITIGTGSDAIGINPTSPGTDKTVEPEVGYGPAKDEKVFNEATEKAYSAEFNARHRYLDNISIEVIKTPLGQTSYIITADYRGEITVYQYFKCHMRCDLTLAEYSDNLVFKDSVWKSVHIEKWLGTYHANYSEWEDVLDKGQEGADNRAVHPENRKEIERHWQQFYHDLPLEAINAMMNFDPRGLTDKTYSSK